MENRCSSTPTKPGVRTAEGARSFDEARRRASDITIMRECGISVVDIAKRLSQEAGFEVMPKHVSIVNGKELEKSITAWRESRNK